MRCRRLRWHCQAAVLALTQALAELLALVRVLVLPLAPLARALAPALARALAPALAQALVLVRATLLNRQAAAPVLPSCWHPAANMLE